MSCPTAAIPTWATMRVSCRNGRASGRAGSVTGNVVRLTPRDFPIFRRMPPGADYPHALRIAEELFAEQLAAEPSPPRPGSKAWKELRKLYVPPYDPGKFPNKWWKLEPALPSRTLTAHMGKDTYSHIHWDSRQQRTISVREAARLQSFPDGFHIRRIDERGVPPDRQRCAAAARASRRRVSPEGPHDHARQGECAAAGGPGQHGRVRSSGSGGKSRQQTVEIIPSASALMQSLRGIGYSPETAVADLIDNSIAAGATAVDVDIDWNDGDPILAILDDGRGFESRRARRRDVFWRSGSTRRKVRGRPRPLRPWLEDRLAVAVPTDDRCWPSQRSDRLHLPGMSTRWLHEGVGMRLHRTRFRVRP